MSFPAPQPIWPTGNRPSFSPDGSAVVFEDGGRLWTVAVPPSRMTAAVPLTVSSAVVASRPDWSWSPEWIVFRGQIRDGATFPWMVSAREPAAAAHRLNVVDAASGDPYSRIDHPSWYGSRTALAAVNHTRSASGPRPVILVIDLSSYAPGSDDPVPATAVTDASSVHAGRPTVAPDDSRIAFAGNLAGCIGQDNRIWVVTPGGAGLRQVDPGQGRSPDWSPDGRWIAFESTRGGGCQLFVVAAEGGTPEPLTAPSSHAGHPEWSRDQSRIAFDSIGGGIWMIDVPEHYRSAAR